MRRTDRNKGMKIVFNVRDKFHGTSYDYSSHRMPNKANPVLLLNNLNDLSYLYRKSFATILQTFFCFTNICPTYIKSYLVIGLQALF